MQVLSSTQTKKTVVVVVSLCGFEILIYAMLVGPGGDPVVQSTELSSTFLFTPIHGTT